MMLAREVMHADRVAVEVGRAQWGPKMWSEVMKGAGNRHPVQQLLILAYLRSAFLINFEQDVAARRLAVVLSSGRPRSTPAYCALESEIWAG